MATTGTARRRATAWMLPRHWTGHYILRVFADEGHALNVSAYDETGVFSTDAVGDTAVVPVGASYDLHYSGVARTVAVSYVGPLGVRASRHTSRSHSLGCARQSCHRSGGVRALWDGGVRRCSRGLRRGW